MVIAFAIAGYLAEHLFNPLLQPNGVLASSVGRLIGIGSERGVGLIFILSGIFVIITAVVIGNLKMLKALDSQTK